MKATFNNYKIEFEASGSLLKLSVKNELVKVIEVKDSMYNFEDFKLQSAKLFKQDVGNIQFVS